jgi:hypothetical protein
MVREQRQATIDAWYAELKAQLSCSRCGENHPACIQFHHDDPTKKTLSISDAIQRRWSTKRLATEIAKCTVICANCHFKLHADEVDE